MRLLLVEDDAMIGESVRVGLRRDGFTVDWVQDGRAAGTWRSATRSTICCCSTWACPAKTASKC